LPSYNKDVFGMVKENKKKNKKWQRQFKITPSLIGQVYKIKGKRQKIYSGLEVRPLKLIG
jgi:ribosomal protein S19